MPQQPQGSSAKPYTLVVCTTCPQTSGDPMDSLRRSVRRCPHGVLVVTGCLSRVLDCRFADGLYAVVQPCSEARAPQGLPVRIGPLRREADAEALGAWLLAGMPDDDSLPGALRAAPAPALVAPLN